MAKNDSKITDNPKLKQKKLSDGQISLYLEYYLGYTKVYDEKLDKEVVRANRKKEFLNLYLWSNPRTPVERQENKETLELARGIRTEREQQLNEDKTGKRIKSSLNKVNFFDFLQSYINSYTKKDKRHFRRVLVQFRMFLNEEYPVYKNSIKPDQITNEMVVGFLEFLQSKFKGEGPHCLFKRFKKVVRFAVSKDLIIKNPCDGVFCKVDELALKKDVLSADEIVKLAETTYIGQNNEIRRAFIFCCYLGIRFCDVRELQYKNVDYGNKFLKFEQMKTAGKSSSSWVELPLNDGLLSIIGTGEGEEKIFKLPSHTMCLKALRNWTNKAGITKHITWHSARHSCGVNILNSGANIKTVSAILGHTSLRMTERYVRAVDELKRNAIDSLPEIKL